MRPWLPALAALALAGTLGCFVPMPATDLTNGRGIIRDAQLAALVPGTSTREEVLLQLGDPDEVQGGGELFLYHWTVTVGMIGAGSSGRDVQRTHLVRLAFDPAGRLASVEHDAGFGDTDQRLRKADDLRLRSRALAAAAARPGAPALRVAATEDRRAERARVGRRAAFSHKLGDLTLPGGIEPFLSGALAAALGAAGFPLAAAEPDASVHLRLDRLWVYTTNGLLTWDLLAEIDCELVIEPALAGAPPLVRHFRAAGKDSTAVYPTVALLSGVLDAALDDLLRQIAGDGVWVQVPRRPATPADTPGAGAGTTGTAPSTRSPR